MSIKSILKSTVVALAIVTGGPLFAQGTPIDAAAFDEALRDVFAVMDEALADERLTSTPTYFEVTTALGFELFRRQGVEVAVVEVGLGGRFDATNAVTPVAGAITSIAFDHELHLGKTLAEIGAEKGGIAKPGLPIVVGTLPSDARAAIERVAAEAGATLVEAAQLADGGLDVQAGRASAAFVTPVRTYPSMRLGLVGRHQVVNAAIAVRLLDTHERGLANGIQVGAYRIGMILGGAGLLFVYARSGWAVMCFCMAGTFRVSAPASAAPSPSSTRPRASTPLCGTSSAARPRSSRTPPSASVAAKSTPKPTASSTPT